MLISFEPFCSRSHPSIHPLFPPSLPRSLPPSLPHLSVMSISPLAPPITHFFPHHDADDDDDASFSAFGTKSFPERTRRFLFSR